MKKFYLLFLFVFVNKPIYSQNNKVYNSSFEEKNPDANFCDWFDNCGSHSITESCCCSRDLNIISVSHEIPFVRNWTQMYNHFCTSDYFNSCAPENDPQSAHVPLNKQGYQKAHSENAYGGIIARDPSPTLLSGKYTEYLQVPLSTLLSGDYYVKMYVSLADSSDYACAGLGMLFTAGPADGRGSNVIVNWYTPQIQSNTVIKDKENWTEISGILHASGGENYLTIGIFNETISTPIPVSGGNGHGIAYYYIDDVIVFSEADALQAGCCPDHVTYEATGNLPAITNVKSFIRAGENLGISGISGKVIVKSGQDVTFKAGEIQLLPGFETEIGANFTSISEPCNNFEVFLNKPIPISVDLPNAYKVCPSKTPFIIATQEAEYFRFHAYTTDAGHEIFYNEGPIESNLTSIWDGRFENGYVWPNPNKEILYTLELTSACNNKGLTKVGNIAVTVYCNPSGKKEASDSVQTKKDSIVKPALQISKQTDIFALSLYPNPNNGSMQIDYTLPENEPGQFEVFDLSGKKMLSYPLKGGKNNLTISNADLGNGIYLYQLLSNNRVIAKDKLVIIK